VDNGYAQFARYVQQNLPSNEPLNASGDPIKFRYFLPNRLVFDQATPADAVRGGIHYFALTPKDVKFRYGKIRPELAEWIQSGGKKLFSFSGDSYGEIYLYYVDHPVQSSGNQQTQNNTGEHWRSFHKAKTGFVGVFVIGLFGWFLFCGVLSFGAHKIQSTIDLKPAEINEPSERPKFSPLAIIKNWFSS